MLLLNLIDQKAKKSTTKDQRERRTELVGKLVKEINNIGKLTVKMLNENDSRYETKIRSGSLELEREYTEKLDKLLIEIMGSDEAVEAQYRMCCKLL